MAIELTTYERVSHTGADDPALDQIESTLVRHPPEFDLDDLPDSRSSTTGPQSRSPFQTRNPRASLTFTNCLALVISLQIGSGIFFVPSQVSVHVPSVGAGVLVWFVGGLLAWTGAASFIELGLRIPKNGGIQEYLNYCFGEFPAFTFVWIFILVVAPASMAMIAIIFSNYFAKSVCPDAWASSLLVERILALIGLGVVTFINCWGIRTGALVANGFLVLKLFAVSTIALLGLGFALRGETGGPSVKHHGWFGTDDQFEKQSVWESMGNYVTALFGVLFSYGGWDTVGFVAGDMRDPVRDIPRVLNVAMTIVIMSFVSVNMALYTIIPIEAMRDTTTPVVDFGIALFGKAGGLIASLVVAASALGSLNASIFATARLSVAASQRQYFPGILANLHFQPGEPESDYYTQRLWLLSPAFQHLVLRFASLTADLRCEKEVPIYALLLNSTLVSFYICIGTFDGLVTFVGVAGYLFFFLAVLGIYNIRRAGVSTGYTTWTPNPFIFCIASGFIVLRGVVTDPLHGAAIGALVAVGWLAFRWKFRQGIGAAEADMGS